VLLPPFLVDGAQVTGGEERDKTLVEDLIALRDQMDHVVDVAFQRRTAFQHTLKVGLLASWARVAATPVVYR